VLLGVVAWGGGRYLHLLGVMYVQTVASCNRLSCTELWSESGGMRFDTLGIGPNASVFIRMAVKLSVVK
jgi:hypothetical protein